MKLENTYVKLPDKLYSFQNPEPVLYPKLEIFNDKLGVELGLDISFLKSEYGIDVLAGNKVLEGTTPISQAYAGHQFGYFTMLGDGRAVLLGEFVGRDGIRYDLQLKGSGETPYSRGGDGRAALGPMLREYIISEAMNGLRIPTTRSLAVTSTGENILRQNGDEKGAVLARIAKSHIRVGTFQFLESWGTRDDIKSLADYVIERHYKEIKDDENKYLSLLKKVRDNQAELIAKWQLVGFIHGVMNTDNMAISGETIDYGPCAFMDVYNPDTVFSSIDKMGRYAYKNQPQIGGWNLARFAEALIPLLSNSKEEAIKMAQEVIYEYINIYKKYWYDGMRKKLGLFGEEKGDINIINELLKLMEKYKADFTNTFYKLTINNLTGLELFDSNEFWEWLKAWKARINESGKSDTEIAELMKSNNPTVIPRNHKVEEALEAASGKGDLSKVKKLVEVVSKPYDYSNIYEEYTYEPPKTSCPYKTYCGT